MHDRAGSLPRRGRDALAAAGAAVLAVRGRQAYLAPWVCLVVGVHFWPLAPLPLRLRLAPGDRRSR